jgi:hypothetical protein
MINACMNKKYYDLLSLPLCFSSFLLSPYKERYRFLKFYTCVYICMFKFSQNKIECYYAVISNSCERWMNKIQWKFFCFRKISQNSNQWFFHIDKKTFLSYAFAFASSLSLTLIHISSRSRVYGVSARHKDWNLCN